MSTSVQQVKPEQVEAPKSDLPEGWAETSIPDLIAAGGVFSDGDWVESKDQDPSGDVRLIQLADIGDGFFRNRSNRYLTSAKAKELGCTFLQLGDVLVARMPDPLGRACIFPGDEKPSVTAVDVCIIRPCTAQVDRRWLMHGINSPDFRAAIEQEQKGTTRGRVSRSSLAMLRLRVPPTAEQQRIADKIEKLFSTVLGTKERLAKVSKILTYFRQAVLAAACSGKLTEDWRERNIGIETGSALLNTIKAELGISEKDGLSADFDLDLPTIPDSWVWAPTGHLGQIRGGIQKQPKRTPKRNAYPYLRVANVLRDRLDLREMQQMELFGSELETYRLEPGDLLVVEGNGSLSEIGRSALWRGQIINCVHQNHIIRVRFCHYVPEFANAYWNSPLGIASIAQVAVTTAGLYSLSTKKIARIPIPVAPLEEQTEIVRRVESLFKLADAIEKRVAAGTLRSERLTQAILAKAFRGELVPTEAELARREGRSYEPASALLGRIKAEREAAPQKQPMRGKKIMAVATKT